MSRTTRMGAPARAVIILLAILTGIALSACAGQGAAPTPTIEAPAPATATPAPAPTQAGEATATPAPAGEATATPAPQSALPAPLIYLQDGQLYRLDAEGASVTKLTDEPAPAPDAAAITAFDVSPADGSLVYLRQQAGEGGQIAQALVLAGADGGNPSALLSSPYLTQPRFSPDGAQIAFGIVPAIGAEAAGLSPGVYRLALAGGAPELVQPSASFATMPAPPEARAYAPGAWSPDGARLALQAFLPASEFCELAIKDLAGGGLVTPAAPAGLVTSCRTPAWSADSMTLYVPIYEPGMFGAFAGLAQVSAADGVLTMPLANKVGDTWISLVGLTPLADGSFRGFVSTSAAPISADPTQPAPLYTLHSLGLDGALTPLREDSQNIWGGPLWAPDGAGAVILTSQDPGSSQELVWVPADGSPLVTLASGVQTGEVRWGR